MFEFTLRFCFFDRVSTVWDVVETCEKHLRSRRLKLSVNGCCFEVCVWVVVSIFDVWFLQACVYHLLSWLWSQREARGRLQASLQTHTDSKSAAAHALSSNRRSHSLQLISFIPSVSQSCSSSATVWRLRFTERHWHWIIKQWKPAVLCVIKVTKSLGN